MTLVKPSSEAESVVAPAGPYAAQWRLLEVLAGDAPLAHVLDSLVRMIEEQSPTGMLGSILLLDPDGIHLRHGAAPHLPRAYNEAIDGITIGPAVGSCGTAAFLRAPVYVSDIASDSRWAEFRDLAARHHLRACWSTPILSRDGEVLGTFAMYYREPRRPNDQDLALVGLATGTASIVIQRRRGEESLRTSETRLRSVFGQAATGVVQADASGRLTMVNQRWCEMLGYDEAELLRMTIADVTEPSEVAATLEAVRRLAAGGPDFVVEKRYRRKDGIPLWASSSVSAMREADGSYLGLVAVVVDITARKQAEGASAALHAELEQELADATRLQEISTELIREGDIDALYHHIIGAAIAVMHSDMASMQMLEPGRRELRLLAWEGFHPASAAFWEWVRLDSTSSCGAALRSGRRTFVADVETCDFMAGSADLDEYRRCGIRAMQSTPLLSRSGRLLGMISNHWRQPHQPAPRDLRLLDVLARQAADLIERKRSDGLVTEQTRVLEMVATEAALPDVLAAVIRMVEQHSDGLLGSILVRHQNGGRFCLGIAPSLPADYTETLQQAPIAPPYLGPCNLAAHRGETVVVTDIASDERWSKDWRDRALDFGLRACHSTPILGSDGMVLGSLGLHWRDPDESKAPDVQLLETATHLAGIAIERQRAEQELRASEDSLRIALQTGRLGRWELDLVSGALESSDSCKANFGLAPDEPLPYSRLLELIHPEDLPQMQAAVRRAVGTGTEYEAEYRAVWPDGSEHWILARGRAFPAGGSPARLVGVTLDVTERKRAEERLRQSTKMEAIGRLAGGIAHDFNNQLQALRGFADYAAGDPGLGQQGRYDLLEVRKAADRMADLTRQLLAYSRQQVLKPEVLDLDRVILESEALLRRLIGAQIEFRVERAPGPKWVRADLSQIQQVLLNLCINARDAMPGGGRLVIRTDRRTVAAEGESAAAGEPVVPGHYAELTVSDEGTGIAPGHLPHIFEPFFTTKDVGEGTGLGLATVHGVVTQSQGYVRVESGPARGTRFIVLLPLAARPAEVPAPPEPVEHRPSARELVLVVEDEDAVRTLLARTLTEAGYDTIAVSDGREALDVLARQDGRVACVLTDVVMPVLGGRELAVRLAESHPELPLVWMSGYPRDLAFAGGEPAAEQRFLQKPVAPELLIARIRAAVEQKGGRPR